MNTMKTFVESASPFIDEDRFLENSIIVGLHFRLSKVPLEWK